MQRSDPTTNPFDLIRATVEADIAAPGVLAVGSALAGDGTTGVTAGIVRALAAAGYPTLAVDAGAGELHAVGIAAAATSLADAVRPTEAGCDCIAFTPAQARTASATAVAAFYAAARARYAYTVIAADVIGAGGLAFARGADGVLLALREGRAVASADRDVVTLFERLNVRFIGVVATREERSRTGAAALGLHDRLQPPSRGVLSVSEDTAPAGIARIFSRSAV